MRSLKILPLLATLLIPAYPSKGTTTELQKPSISVDRNERQPARVPVIGLTFSHDNFPGVTCNDEYCKNYCIGEVNVGPVIQSRCCWHCEYRSLLEELWIRGYCLCYIGTIGDASAHYIRAAVWGRITPPGAALQSDEIVKCNEDQCKQDCVDFGYDREKSECSDELMPDIEDDGVFHSQMVVCICRHNETGLAPDAAVPVTQ